MGKAPHHGKPWLTEEEICDQLEANDYALLREMFPACSGRWRREFEIGDSMRPDFVCLGSDGYWPFIAIVEVKITADAMSCVQLLHYATIARRLAHRWAFHTVKRINKAIILPNVDLLLVARWFDKSVTPFFESGSTQKGPVLTAARVELGDEKRISLDFECGPEVATHGFAEMLGAMERELPVVER